MLPPARAPCDTVRAKIRRADYFANSNDRIQHMTVPALPCYPCPYNASCCAYGATVTDEEAAAIEVDHGHGFVYKTRWGEWRTRVRNKRCALFRDGGCTIHAKSYYPAVCRGFPWTDAETGGRYEYDVTICGAFVDHPELIEIQRAIPRAANPPASEAGAPISGLVDTDIARVFE